MTTKNREADQVRAALQALGGPSVVVPHVLIKFAGGLEAGAVVAGLLFWSDKGKRGDGFFYKSYKDWQEERMVSQYMVSKVTRDLAARGLLEIQKHRANGAPTLHYRVTHEFYKALAAFIEEQRAEAIEASAADYQKFDNPIMKDSTIGLSKNEQSLTAVTQQETQPTAARSDEKDERPTAQEPSAPSTSARVNEARARRAREEEAWRDTLAAMQRDCEGDEERFGVWSLATGKRAKALAKTHGKTPDELLTLWRAIVETANKPVAYLNSIANAGTWQPPAAPRRPTKKLAFWVDGERVLKEVPA